MVACVLSLVVLAGIKKIKFIFNLPAGLNCGETILFYTGSPMMFVNLEIKN